MLNPDFREFVELLNEKGAKYLVIGGYAVALHGYPRYTKDVDFWIWLDQENAKKVVAVNFIDIESLIKTKLATGQPQDRVDAAKLTKKKKK